MTEPNSSIIALVALGTFITGETFWKTQISATGALMLPQESLRTYALTIIVLFSYYLYRKEEAMQSKMAILTDRMKSLDVMKSEFIANVSHELRTPLTVIKNTPDLLRDKNTALDKSPYPCDERLFELMALNISRQAKLIDAIVKFADIENNKLLEERVKIDLRKVCESAVKTLAGAAEEKNIQVITQVENNIPEIHASDHQIKKAYTTLLKNVIKKSPANGEIFLRVKVSGEKIKTEIQNTDYLADTNELEDAFSAFTNFSELIERRGEEIDLDLIGVKMIIESHNGTISAESAHGQGTTFTFFLPK